MSDPVTIVARDPYRPQLIKPISQFEVETGFPSYVAYLEAHQPANPKLSIPLWELRHLREYEQEKRKSLQPSHCFVLDVSRPHTSAETMTVHFDESSETDDNGEITKAEMIDFRHKVALKLLEALRNPVADGSIRVVIWYTDRKHLAAEWVDALGLGLRVPPSYFEILLQQMQFSRDHVEDEIRWLHEDEIRFLHPQHLLIGNAVVTILNGNMVDNAHHPPTILITYLAELRPDHTRDWKIHERLYQQEIKVPSFARLSRQNESTLMGKEQRYCTDHFRHYQKLLHLACQQESYAHLNNNSLFYTSILPLFRFNILGLQVDYNAALSTLVMLQAYYRGRESEQSQDNVYYVLDQHRFQLRRSIEKSDDSLHFFQDLMIANDDAVWLEGRHYQATKKDLENTLGMARRLETEIRDYMAIVVGLLSINESRKSIQLTNVSIEEGKQVTILAFVYVPLNLATSIFGMNLQQLNQEGQQLWVFITTAALAVIITGGIWWTINQVNSVRRWIRKPELVDKSDNKRDPQYSIGVRLAMLYYLVFSGHMKWMFRSNIWLRVLANSKKVGDTVHDEFPPPPEYTTTVAGHYISESLKEDFTKYWFENVKW